MFLQNATRYREVSAWRKSFRAEWRKCEDRAIGNAEHVEHAYRPDVKRWVCTCPAFLVSRFLICKHLIQLLHRVPTTFFRTAQRNRTTPFWKHADLVPLTEEVPDEPDNAVAVAASFAEMRHDPDIPDDEDDDFLDDDEPAWLASTATFEAEIDHDIALLEDFVAGLKHQRQFKDFRVVEAVRRQGAGMLRLAEALQKKEKNVQINGGRRQNTWSSETSSVMFFHPRPARRIE